MSNIGFCGEWFIVTCDKKLIAIHTKEKREPFVFDCSTAERRPKNTDSRDDKTSDCATEETESDKILAFSVSPSGKLVALIDETKRLVLFQCEPSWRCISIRWAVRRCTSLVFNQAEDQLLVADKSGDVYSFSVVDPQAAGKLKMGHLSMLLAITMSPDNRYIITADSDEKIRVSHLRCAYNIQSFCLGHQEFVSTLLVPLGHPHYLLSGSGDGTIKLWEYESGRQLQTCNLKEFEETQTSVSDKEKTTVCRIVGSPDGHHIAVQSERVSTVQFFIMKKEGGERLLPHSRLTLPHRPLDMTFDSEGRLWLLMDINDAPLQIYVHRQDCWECDTRISELNTVTEAFKSHWSTSDAITTRTNASYEHLHKVGFDNVKTYMKKKEQRLKEQQLKTTRSQKASSTKKAKMDIQQTH